MRPPPVIVDCPGGGNHHEEVAGHHDLGMVADKGQPALFRVWGAHRTVFMEVLADGARRIRMVSLSFNSLAMRSSPQVGFAAAITRMSLRRSLGLLVCLQAGISGAKRGGVPYGAGG